MSYSAESLITTAVRPFMHTKATSFSEMKPHLIGTFSHVSTSQSSHQQSIQLSTLRGSIQLDLTLIESVSPFDFYQEKGKNCN